jgi:hypothetical protein
MLRKRDQLEMLAADLQSRYGELDGVVEKIRVAVDRHSHSLKTRVPPCVVARPSGKPTRYARLGIPLCSD